MPAPDALVSKLARAYALSELISVDDARMRHLLEGAAEELAAGGEVELEVRDGAIRGPDGPVGGAEDLIGELARDLEIAGVERLGFPSDTSVDSLLAFVDQLRRGSGSGDGALTARAFAGELPQIGVGFGKGEARRWGPAGAVSEVFGGAFAAGEAAGDLSGRGGAAAPPPEPTPPGLPGSPGASTEPPSPGPADEAEPPVPGPGSSPPAAPERPAPTAPEGSAEGSAPPAEPPPSAPSAPDEPPPPTAEPSSSSGPAGTAPDGPAPPATPPDEDAAAPPDEDEPAPATAPTALPGEEEGELGALVSAYLEAGPEGRDEPAREIRTRSEALSGEGAVETLAGAVERLAAAGLRGGGDRHALDLAREILGPGTAERIALDLGGIRDEEERRRKIQIVSRLGEEMAAAISDALSDTDDRAARRAYIDAMVALGDDAVAEAEAMVEDSRWWVVRNGVSILGDVGGEEAIGDLTATLGHEDARVRRETVMALAKLGGDDAATLILGMVDDPEPEVRSAVAMGLGVLRVEKAVRPLLQRLEEEDDEDVEVQILRSLGQLGDPGAVPAIEKRAVAGFFSRPPRPVRIAAYKALSDIGTPHAVELLEDAVDDKDGEVRAAVRSILKSREA